MVGIFFIVLGVFAYDYNLLEVEWKPTQCLDHTCSAGYLSTDFNIHGYWPSNYDGSYPSFCSTIPFRITSTTQSLLQSCWVSYDGDPTTFWEHEWEKHGTCVVPTVTCDSYFTNTANLYLGLAILKSLNTNGIVPNDSKLYQVSDLAKVFKYTVQIGCTMISTSYYLNTIGFCYDANNNWFSCKASTSNCGSGFILHT